MKRLMLVVVAVVLSVSSAFAQNAEPTNPFVSRKPAQENVNRFGVTFSAMPTFEFSKPLLDKFIDTNELNVVGHGFVVGFSRGSIEGGAWGARYTHLSLSTGSSIVADKGVLSVNGQDFASTDTYQLRQASLSGFEVFKIVPFATIAHRVQPGIEFGAGFLRFGGEVDKASRRYSVGAYNPSTGKYAVNESNVATTGSISGVLKDLGGPSMLPLLRAEASVGVIVAPRVKINFAGGLAFPGVERFRAGTTISF